MATMRCIFGSTHTPSLHWRQAAEHTLHAWGSTHLRYRYIEMLRRAKDEGIVTHLSTLWDTYFEGGRDHRYPSCSSINIPYLEGDYWPGACVRAGQGQRGHSVKHSDALPGLGLGKQSCLQILEARTHGAWT